MKNKKKIISRIRTHDLTHASLDFIHYSTRGYLSECMKYLQFYHQKIKIFCTKKTEKLVILKKKIVLKIGEGVSSSCLNWLRLNIFKILTKRFQCIELANEKLVECISTCEGEACRECDQNHEDDLDNCPCQKNCPCKYINKLKCHNKL